MLPLAVVVMLASCKDSNSNKKTKDPISSSEKKWIKLKEDANVYFAVLPDKAENVENPTSEGKIKLGQTLYFDNRLSKNQTQSCNTCHDLNKFGVDGNPVSGGDDGVSKGTRNSPTTLNAAFHVAQFWDGRAKDVEEQAGMPVTNPVEMNIPSEKFLVDRLGKVPFYVKMFAEAFPEDKKPISYKNIRKAIASFERELITPSRFDKFLSGDISAISDEEKIGLKTFISQGCVTCHSGATLGGTMMQKFPVFGKYEDYISGKVDMGKYVATKNDMDKFMFKVPALRNVKETAPYFHNGSVVTLSDAVMIMSKAQLNKEMTKQQADKIVTFLGTLTGELNPKYKNAPKILEKK